MKTVIFARHAKSNWGEVGIDDFDRPLNEKGQEDAPLMALYLQQCGYVVQQIISSDAVRAKATAYEYQQALTPNVEIQLEHSIYLATHLDIDSIVQNLSEKHSTVMIVGHNPTMSDVISYYVENSRIDMPACAVAIVQFDANNWKNVQKSKGDLLAFEYPEKHL